MLRMHGTPRRAELPQQVAQRVVDLRVGNEPLATGEQPAQCVEHEKWLVWRALPSTPPDLQASDPFEELRCVVDHGSEHAPGKA
jgi:hypothetical protein